MYAKGFNMASKVYFRNDLVTFIDFENENKNTIGVFIGTAYLIVNKIDLHN